MGMQDRDYLRERRSDDDRMFWPPRPRASSRGIQVLALAALVYAGLKGAAWIDEYRAARRMAPSPPAVAPSVPQSPPPQATPGFQAPARATSATDSPLAGHRIAIKCVAPDGAVSYVDSHEHCAQQARRQEVTMLPRQNEADGLSPQQRAAALRPRPGAAPGGVAAAPVVTAAQVPAQDHRAVCEGLEQEVQWIDAWTRQPLSPSEQDYWRDRRKKVRDKQFELRC